MTRTLPEGARVRLSRRVSAMRLWDRRAPNANSGTAIVPAGTIGRVVQPVVIQQGGAVWIACHSHRSRHEVVGIDGYEIVCEVPGVLTTRRRDGSVGPLMEEVWAYVPPTDLREARR